MSNPGQNILTNPQFTNWMTNITQAINALTYPSALAPRVLNIVKVNDYFRTDAEDPYEWIQHLATAAVVNNWNDTKILQIAISAMKGSAAQWYLEEANRQNFVGFARNGANSFEVRFFAKYVSPSRKSL